MRLGDLDALYALVGDLRGTLHKEQTEFNAMTQSEFEIKDSMFLYFQYVIDNAPTVEPFEPDYVGAERLKARQRGYEEGYHNGMKIGKTLNPKIKQGEWKVNNYGEHVCPICGHYALYDEEHDNDYYEVQSNFCPECGADMRGKKDDLSV